MKIAKQLKKEKLKKGVSLYLSVIVLAVLLGICLGLISILVAQLRTLRGMEESVTALYAADTGIEIELYKKNYATEGYGYTYSDYLDLDGDGGGIGGESGICPETLQDRDDACYQVLIFNPKDENPLSPFLFGIQSVGVFRETRRAIEVKF